MCVSLFESETFLLLLFDKMEVYLAIVIAHNIIWILHVVNHHEQSQFDLVLYYLLNKIYYII